MIYTFYSKTKSIIIVIINNNFDINVNFKDNDISIESVVFLPNVKDSLFFGVEDGKTILEDVQSAFTEIIELEEKLDNLNKQLNNVTTSR